MGETWGKLTYDQCKKKNGGVNPLVQLCIIFSGNNGEVILKA